MRKALKAVSRMRASAAPAGGHRQPTQGELKTMWSGFLSPSAASAAVVFILQYRCVFVWVCVYYCNTYYKAVREYLLQSCSRGRNNVCVYCVYYLTAVPCTFDKAWFSAYIVHGTNESHRVCLLLQDLLQCCSYQVFSVRTSGRAVPFNEPLDMILFV